MKLSIVIPAYNESTAIRSGVLDEVLRLILCTYPDTELILIDDGSTDDTMIAARLQTRHMRSCYTYRANHAGKAAAIMAGMLMALGDQILVADLDQATPVIEVKSLRAAIDRGADVAIGSRGLTRAGAPISRYILSVGQVVLKRLLIGLPYLDTQCGFKLWRRDTAEAVLDRLVIYNRARMTPVDGPCVSSGFDVEMLLVAKRLGYRIVEVPVKWQYQPSRRVKFGRDAQRGISDLIRIFAADMAGLYPRKNTLSNVVRTMLETRQ